MRKHTIANILSLFLTVIIPVLTQAQSIEQQPPLKDWFLRDPEQDHVQGVSAEKAYATVLAGQPSRTIIVAVVDGEMVVRRYSQTMNKVLLLPDNEKFKAIEVGEFMAYQCWGVVTCTIHIMDNALMNFLNNSK